MIYKKDLAKLTLFDAQELAESIKPKDWKGNLILPKYTAETNVEGVPVQIVISKGALEVKYKEDGRKKVYHYNCVFADLVYDRIKRSN